MDRFDADEWTCHVPEKEGERSCLIELSSTRGHLDIEVRCAQPVVLNAITSNGETILLGLGQVVAFRGKVSNCSAVEIVARSAFAYRSAMTTRWLEKPDPKKMTVEVDESAEKPIQDLLREELRKYVGKLEAQQMLATDVDVEELLDDIDNGDLDFEEEPDPFGLGYEERMAKYLAEEEDDPGEGPEGDSSGAAGDVGPDEPVPADAAGAVPAGGRDNNPGAAQHAKPSKPAGSPSRRGA